MKIHLLRLEDIPLEIEGSGEEFKVTGVLMIEGKGINLDEGDEINLGFYADGLRVDAISGDTARILRAG